MGQKSPTGAKIFDKQLIRTPAKNFKKAGAPNFAEEYDFTFTSLFVKGLSLVNNYRARVATTATKSMVVSGYEIEPSADEGELNLVFNKEKRKYGVWTREVRLSGDAGMIMAVQE